MLEIVHTAGGYGPPGGYPPQPGGYGPPPGGGGNYGPPPGGGNYGPPGGGGGYYGPPQPPGYAPGPQMMMVNAKNPGIAIILEVLPGMFFQTFGIGNLYAGNVGVGLGLMFGYWVLTAINFALCFVFVGFITWPMCWIAAMIIAPILANSAAKTANARAMSGQLG